MKSFSEVRGTVQRWGAEVAMMLAARWWGFFLASAILAVGFAQSVYVWLDLPQSYSELVVGAIAWSYQSKFHDYAVLYAFVLCFMVALTLFGTLAMRINRDHGASGVDRLHDIVLLLCAPAGIWAVGLLTSKADTLVALQLSQCLLVFCLPIGAFVCSRRPSFWTGGPDAMFRVLHTWLLFVVISGLAVSAVGVAINRLGACVHTHHWLSSTDVWNLTWIAVGAAIATAWLGSWSASTATLLEARAKRLLHFAQLFLPLLLLCLLPPAWTWASDATLATGYHLTIFTKIFVLGCVIAAFVESHLRFRAVTRADPHASPLQLFSVGSLVGVLLFLKMSPIGLPWLASDDYHLGEMLVPWWSWADHGLLPFWDYAPARGLLNYVPGLLNELLFGGSPATLRGTFPFIFVIIFTVAAFVLRSSIGMGGAFVALLLGPIVNGAGEIDVVITTFLAYFCWGYFRWTPERWLVAFAALGVAMLLYTPGQGALTLVACTPLALYVLWNLYRQRPRRLFQVVLGIGVVLALVFLVTPVGKMFLGALRYGAEQSSINSIAHGIPWSVSFGQATTNPWLFELMRASWLAVAIWAAVLVFKASVLETSPARARILVYATPILIILLLFVVRAAGRIDAGGSRLALAGDWALSLLLPLLLFLAVRVRGAHLFWWITAAALVIPHAGGFGLPPYPVNFDPIGAGGMLPATTTMSKAGTRFGVAILEKDHLARVDATRQVLDAVLDPDETYLDLTGRHAVYYYVDRKPPIESGAMYNLVGEKQQLRAIASIRSTNLPAVLLSSDNLTFDGGPSSLRSNLVYRELMRSKGYKLASIGRQVWMVRDDRLARLAALPETSSIRSIDDSPDGPLVAIFHSSDLWSIPASWGRSVGTLKRELVTVHSLDSHAAAAAHDVDKAGDDEFIVTGDDPFIRFDIASAGLSGDRAGLLSFDFSCVGAPEAQPTLGVYWSTSAYPENAASQFSFRGQQGRLIVPIDSSPAWLLAQHIGSIRLDIEKGSGSCKTFSVKNVQLMRRSAAEAR